MAAAVAGGKVSADGVLKSHGRAAACTACTSALRRRSWPRRRQLPGGHSRSRRLHACSSSPWLVYCCRLTLAVSGRGERMRASEPLERDVRRLALLARAEEAGYPCTWKQWTS